MPSSRSSSGPRRAGFSATRAAVGPVAVLAFAIALVGCAGSASPAPTGAPSDAIPHGTGPTDLVLRYEEVGGFVPQEMLLGHYPTISVYGDGTVITMGATPAIFPGPALPALSATKITEAGIQRLLALAVGTGLFVRDASYDATGIADATTAQFTIVTAGVRHVVSANALFLTGQGMEGDAANVVARSRLRALSDRLGDLRTTLGADALPGDGPYAYAALKLYVRSGAPANDDPTLARPPLAWPLATGLAAFGQVGTGMASDFRCGILTGPDLELVRPLAAQATQITPWSSGGSLFTVMPLPELPDGRGCAAA